MKLLTNATTIAASLLLLGSSSVRIVSAQEDDIPTTAKNLGLFTTLVAGLSAADLVSTLSEPNGPYTVFAPTDAAFGVLPSGFVTCLLKENNNNDVLSAILLYHVANNQVVSTQLDDGMLMIPTLQGENITVGVTGGVNSGNRIVKINNSLVINSDVLATNGVIHIINQVLVPPSIDVPAFLESSSCDDDNIDTMDESSLSSSSSLHVSSFLEVTTSISIITTTGAIVFILLQCNAMQCNAMQCNASERTNEQTNEQTTDRLID